MWTLNDHCLFKYANSFLRDNVAFVKQSANSFSLAHQFMDVTSFFQAFF